MLQRTVQIAVVLVFFGLGQSAAVAQTADIYGAYSKPSIKPASQMARRVNFAGFYDPKMTLRDALDKLGKTYDLPLDLCGGALHVSADIVYAQLVACPPIPKMRDVPLEVVVCAVVARIKMPTGATFVYRKNYIEIISRSVAMHRAVDAIGWKIGGLPFEYADSLYAWRTQAPRRPVVDDIQFVADLAYWAHVAGTNARIIAKQQIDQAREKSQTKPATTMKD
jgi:hypothetical protein